MKRHLLLLLAIAFTSSCGKKSDPEEAGKSDPGKGRTPLSGISGGEKGSVVENKPIRNTYAEKHWPIEAEVEDEWSEEYKAAATPEAKLEVLGRKQSSGPEQLAGLVRRALREPNEQVRAEAVQMLTSFVTLPDEVADLVTGAVHDPSSEVRALAMEAAIELLPETRLEVYKNTIAVPDPEVRKSTIVELGRMSSKPAFEVLMTGLQNPDPGFRQEVNFEIKLLVDQEFESYDQAKNWWDGPGEVSYSDQMVHTGGNE